MPGYAFSLETLRGANPPGLTSNPQAASLGAMGPDLFRFLPPSPALAAALTPTGVFLQETGGKTNLSLIQEVIKDPSIFLSLSAAQQKAIEDLVPLLEEIWAKPVSTMYALILGPSGLNVETSWPLLTRLQSLLSTVSTIASSQNEGRACRADRQHQGDRWSAGRVLLDPRETHGGAGKLQLYRCPRSVGGGTSLRRAPQSARRVRLALAGRSSRLPAA